MISSDQASALLVDAGGVEYPLNLHGGEITDDAGRWPRVSGTLRITAAPAVAALLDPREDVRIRLAVSVTSGAGISSRTLDLGVRSRTRSQRAGSAVVEVASDEALLSDYRPPADDLTPQGLQGSLRSIIGYVLGKAIPGAVLEATPAHDADLTTYSDADNLFKDPRLQVAPTGAGCTVAADSSWPGKIDGIPHKGIALYAPTSTDSYAWILPNGGMSGMNVGETWVLSATGRTLTPQSGATNPNGYARKLVVYVNTGGYKTFTSVALPNANVATRVAVEFTVPEGTTEVFARAYHGAMGGEVNWSQVRLTRKSVTPGIDDTAYFWGGKPDTAVYDYSWNGGADLSPSHRRAIIDRTPDVLIWKAGRSAMEFLLPLFQSAGLRLVCDERRRWTLRDETYTQPGTVTVRYGVNLRDGDDKLARDGDWGDGHVVWWRWRDYAGVQQERVDAYVPPGATRVVEVIMEHPYPGVPGYAEYLTRRAKGRGREVTVTTGTDWNATTEQPITITLDGAPLQAGLVQALTFNLDRNEMTVTTRTADIPAGAIALLPGTIDSLPGTIDSLT